nr:hypothetical protein [Corynebacterium sp. UBA5992]
MTNAVFTTGPITKQVSAPVSKFRLVSLVAEKIKHADGTALPYGYVGHPAAPEAREDNDVAYGLPRSVAVVTHQAVVLIETDATDFKPGDVAYVAADGKVAKTGTVAVGLIERERHYGCVRVHMFHPAALAAGASE